MTKNQENTLISQRLLDIWRNPDFQKRHAIFSILDERGYEFMHRLIDNKELILQQVADLVDKKIEYFKKIKSARTREDLMNLERHNYDVQLCELLCIEHTVAYPGVQKTI